MPLPLCCGCVPLPHEHSEVKSHTKNTQKSPEKSQGSQAESLCAPGSVSKPLWASFPHLPGLLDGANVLGTEAQVQHFCRRPDSRCAQHCGPDGLCREESALPLPPPGHQSKTQMHPCCRVPVKLYLQSRCPARFDTTPGAQQEWREWFHHCPSASKSMERAHIDFSGTCCTPDSLGAWTQKPRPGTWVFGVWRFERLMGVFFTRTGGKGGECTPGEADGSNGPHPHIPVPSLP